MSDSWRSNARQAVGAKTLSNRALQAASLSATAAWCSAHGLAEMSGFKQFAHLKDALGGEEAFFRAIFQHMGLGLPRHRT